MAEHSIYGPPLVLMAYEAKAQVDALLADHGELPPPPPPEELHTPTAEQVQAADSVFASTAGDEMQQVGLIMGLYAGVAVGHQLVLEAAEELKRKDEEDEKRARAISPFPGCG